MSAVDNPITRECNACGAMPGGRCMTGTGKFLADRFHMARRTGLNSNRSPEQLAKGRIYGVAYYEKKKAGAL